MKNGLRYLAEHSVLLLIVPMLLSIILEPATAVAIFGITSICVIGLTLSAKSHRSKKDETALKGKIVEVEDEGTVMFVFELVGEAKKLETQDQVVFDVVRTGTQNTSP